MICRTVILFLFVGIFMIENSISFAQIEEDALSHLVENDLKNEHLTYLNSVHIADDSVHFFLAKYYLHYSDWPKFYQHYRLGESVAKNDRVFLEIATSRLLGVSDSIRVIWFESEIIKHPFLAHYDSLYRFATEKKSGTIEVPLAFQESMEKYKKANKKSPLLAASISTIIPGLGKVYLGNYRTGLFSLFTMTVFGLQTYESYEKKGADHVLTITNAGFFTGYYFANIVGSFRDAKQKKIEYRNQFLIDASSYYHSRISPSLY